MNFSPVGRNPETGELYMKFHEPFTIVERIQLLQRWIMVHSCIYYELDSNIADDYTYDNNAKQLASLINEYPEEAKRSKYYKYYYDYTGETGYHLLGRVEKDDPALYRYIRIDAYLALDIAEGRRVVSGGIR